MCRTVTVSALRLLGNNYCVGMWKNALQFMCRTVSTKHTVSALQYAW